MSQQVDERIINNIHQFVNEGVRDVREIQRHVKIFIKNELFHGTSLLPPTSCRYHPKKERYSESHVHSGSKTKVFQKRSGELRIKV